MKVNAHYNIQITASYEHARDGRPCCISGGYFHQSWDCNEPLSYCKWKCDNDNDCKGYVSWTYERPEDGCLIATTSIDIPWRCSLRGISFGNVAPLIANGTCGQDRDDWGGCYIKLDEGRDTAHTRLLKIIQ